MAPARFPMHRRVCGTGICDNARRSVANPRCRRGEPGSDNGGFRRRGAGPPEPAVYTDYPLGRRRSASAFDGFYNTQRSGI